MRQPVSERILLIQKHLFPAGCCIQLKVTGRGPLHGASGVQVKAVRTARVRVGGGDASSTQQLLTRGFCRTIRVCFLCLKQAGNFPGFSMKHSKLSFSRITPPPGRGATLTLGRGERPCFAFYCNSHTSHVQPKTNALPRGICSSVTVLILADTSQDSTFPHPGVVLSVPT